MASCSGKLEALAHLSKVFTSIVLALLSNVHREID
jgi:hypothetical protein